MGSALRANDSGSLAHIGGRQASHLRGQCRYCGKVRHFHPFSAQGGRRTFGVMAAKSKPSKETAKAAARMHASDSRGQVNIHVRDGGANTAGRHTRLAS